MQSLDLDALDASLDPQFSSAAGLPPQPASPPKSNSLEWCLTHFSRGACPSDGRNFWLAALALFCNEKGVPEAELLEWAQGHGPLASHGEKRITAVIRAVYARKRNAHASKAYRAPGEQRHAAETASGPRSPGPGPGAKPEPKNWLPALLQTRTQLQKRSRKNITFAQPLFFQDDEPVIWLRTINLIQGQTGAHKSRVAELFAAVLIAASVPACDTVGITRNGEPDADYTLCYVDTERSVSDQFPYAIQQMRERAGYPRDVDPPTFDYVSLEVVPRAERLTALKEYLEHVRRTYQGHLVIVLDVLTDCIGSFNDEKESLLVVDLLNRLINSQDVTFLCVIHENPGGAKARGHLGTEAANKASTVLQIGYLKPGADGPSHLIEMHYLKRRNGRPGQKFYAAYDEETKGLVWADPDALATAQNSRRTVADPLALAAALATALAFGSLDAGTLVAQLMERLRAGDKTIRDRLKELVADATSIPDIGGRACQLTKAKAGKHSVYSLRPIDDPAEPR